MQKPTIFVGSSTEGLEFARAIRNLLRDDAELTLWNEGFFGVGNVFIDTLISAVVRFDFAVLVLTPDDLVQSRSVESFGPRDNLLFELGLFMRRLGRTRTFIVHQADVRMKIPSDLAGITTAQYKSGRGRSSYGQRLARRATASATSSAIWVCPTSRRRSRSTKFGRVRIRPSRACARCR